MKEKQDTVSLPFPLEEHGPNWLFEGNFLNNRKDFNIGGKSIILDDDGAANIWVTVIENK